MTFQQLDIVFNGEIYNFREIRRVLEEQGYTFESHSDTEVILKAFHRWGMGAVQRFIGMFALAIHDRDKGKIFLLRDRAGVKPLFYYHAEDVFLFGSELKVFHAHHAFEKEVDTDALATFLRYGYILAPRTIFRNVQKLEPGHWLEYDLKTRKFHRRKYWEVYDWYNRPKLEMSRQEAVTALEKLLENAFAYRMVSDVPVGVFLSGGYDSTCVTALLQKNSRKPLNTFTIGFDTKEYNEAPLARQYAKILGTEHHEHYCTEKEAMEIIPELAEIYDEPFGDSSAIPTILVSRIAKGHVDVALSADGSDEIFAGYNKHFSESARFETYRKLPEWAQKTGGKFLPLFAGKAFQLMNRYTLGIPNYRNKVYKFSDMIADPSLQNIFDRSNYYFTDREIKKLIRKEFTIDTAFESMGELGPDNDAITKILAVDYKTYLPDDILVKVDRATMSVSLEGREPFLDHRIVEFVAQLPTEVKNHNNIPKYLIKEIVHKYIPESLINRPKKGFSVPFSQWYDGELHELFMEYLSRDKVREVGVLDEEAVEEVIRRYRQGERFLIKNIWFLFVFQQWAQRWL